MIFIIGIVLIITTGYSLLLLFNAAKSSLPLNLALAWFVGAGYFSFINTVLLFGLGINTTLITSLLIIATPIIIVAAMRNRYKIDSVHINAFKNKTAGKFEFVEWVLIVFVLFTLILIVSHGASTPPNSDDSFRLRGYTPFLAYDNMADNKAITLGFLNGVWPTFLPLFFWHLNGQPEQFFLNYLTLMTLIAFLTILYLTPVERGSAKRGIYSAFVIMSIPLFVYHGTAIYMDIVLIMVFALGYLYFSVYIYSNEKTDFKIAILFFLLTFLIKDKGGIAGITGLSTIAAFWLYGVYKRGDKTWKFYAIITVPFVLFLISIWRYSLNIDLLAQYMKISNIMVIKNSTNLVDFVSAIKYKAYGFYHSLFLSGNFGIIFYVFIANVVIYARRIFLTNLIWEFLLTSLVLVQTFLYMVGIYTILEMHQAIVHRVVMMPAVICSLFLVSLWTYKPAQNG